MFERVGAVSKMRLRGLLAAGECLVNGAPGKAGYHVQAGDRIEIAVDLSAATSMKPEPLPLEILYEDSKIIVVAKRAGMLVHPTRGVKSGTLLNALSHYLNKSLESKVEEIFSDSQLTTHNSPHSFIRPGLIHRLDKQTSGLMVIAKTSAAHRILAEQFQRKTIQKKYIAITEGVLESDSGVIDAPIGYDENLRQWSVQENGKPAETRFRVLERREDSTLLELEPVTGRTNQLRIHCAFIGHPILGDEARGGRAFSRLCLHAARLRFRHPASGEWMDFKSALPAEMRRFLNQPY